MVGWFRLKVVRLVAAGLLVVVVLLGRVVVLPVVLAIPVLAVSPADLEVTNTFLPIVDLIRTKLSSTYQRSLSKG